MEFKSQVYTTIEQSKRLIALGIKTETADCCHYYVAGMDDKDVPEDANCPAWSLHRLIEMSLDLSYGVAYCYTAGSNMNETYDEVIDMIEWAISKECFNKDYLEDQK